MEHQLHLQKSGYADRQRCSRFQLCSTDNHTFWGRLPLKPSKQSRASFLSSQRLRSAVVARSCVVSNPASETKRDIFVGCLHSRKSAAPRYLRSVLRPGASMLPGMLIGFDPRELSRRLDSSVQLGEWRLQAPRLGGHKSSEECGVKFGHRARQHNSAIRRANARFSSLAKIGVIEASIVFDSIYPINTIRTSPARSIAEELAREGTAYRNAETNRFSYDLGFDQWRNGM